MTPKRMGFTPVHFSIGFGHWVKIKCDLKPETVINVDII